MKKTVTCPPVYCSRCSQRTRAWVRIEGRTVCLLCWRDSERAHPQREAVTPEQFR